MSPEDGMGGVAMRVAAVASALVESGLAEPTPPADGHMVVDEASPPLTLTCFQHNISLFFLRERK